MPKPLSETPIQVGQDNELLASTIMEANVHLMFNLLPTLDKYGISFEQLFLLEHIARSGPHYPAELARLIGISDAGMNVMLNTLEKREVPLIERERGEYVDNPIKVSVYTTSDGEELLNEIWDALRTDVEKHVRREEGYNRKLSELLETIMVQPLVQAVLDKAPVPELTTHPPAEDEDPKPVVSYAFMRHFSGQLFNSIAPELEKRGISEQGFLLLYFLRRGKQLSIGEIADRLNCTDANASGYVDRLERLGFVKRQGKPADRRSVMVTLDTRGTGITNQYIGVFETARGIVQDLLADAA